MLCNAVSCCAVLCGAVRCGAVRCCAVLCCAVLCCAVLCCAVLCCAVLCYAVLCCAVLCCAVLCCAVLCCAVLCCAVLCCAVLCCAVQMQHLRPDVTVCRTRIVPVRCDARRSPPTSSLPPPTGLRNQCQGHQRRQRRLCVARALPGRHLHPHPRGPSLLHRQGWVHGVWLG